ncbi:MAG: hypothetical protein J7M38_06090, partial [Armatimonadetes bacterium]|nr:hypothetical protein [Armatimonadota bacterium]
MKFRSSIALLCLLSAAAAFARPPATPEEVEENQSLQTDLVTPHKPWARGHVSGPIRALFFVFAGHYGGQWDEPGTRLREVVELMERFDLDADAVFYSRRGNTWSFHGGRLGEERARRLLEKPYELYVIAGFPMEKLPGEIQYMIFERVVEGAGLLYCGGAKSDYLTDRRRIEPTPPALVAGLPHIEDQVPAEVTSAYRLRDGRAVWLNYNAWALTPRAPFTWRGLVDYDYRMLLIGRAALWAAGKESTVQILSVGGDQPLVIDRADDAPRAEVALASSAAQPAGPVTVTLDLAVRRPIDGAVWSLPEQSATVTPDRPAVIRVELPRLRADEYYLDVIARAGGKVVACAAGNLIVESDVGVEALALDDSFIEPGGTMTGTVTLRGEPPAGSVLRLRLRDSYNRVVSLQDVPVKTGQANYPVTFTPDANATIELRAEALLLTGGEEVEMQQAIFTVPKRRHGQMNFVQWDTPRDVLGLYVWDVLKRAGWQISLLGSMSGPTEQPSAARASDVSLVPYS